MAGLTLLFLLSTLIFNSSIDNSSIDNFQSFSGPRITAIAALDQGEGLDTVNGTYALDVVQHICEEEEEVYEPFYDSLLVLTVYNPTASVIRVKSAKLRVPGLGKKGKALRSKRFAPIGQLEIGPGESQIVYTPFLKMTGTSKRFAGTSTIVSEDLAIKNIQVKLIVVDQRGRKYKLKARNAFSFADINRC